MQDNLRYVQTAGQNEDNQTNPNIDPRFWSFNFQRNASSVGNPLYHQGVLQQTPQLAPEETAHFRDLASVNGLNRNTNNTFGDLGNAGSGSASSGNNMVVATDAYANPAPSTGNARVSDYFAPGQADPSWLDYLARTGGGTAHFNEPYTLSQGDSVPGMPDMTGTPGIPAVPDPERELFPQAQEYLLNGALWKGNQDQEDGNDAMPNGDVFEQGQEGQNDMINDPNDFDWIV